MFRSSRVYRPTRVYRTGGATGASGPPAPIWFRDYSTGSLGADATFARASSATYFDSNDDLISVGANTPRFVPGGLLIEDAATNLLADPDDYTTASWDPLNGAVTGNVASSPSGTDGDRLQADNAGGNAVVRVAQDVTPAVSTTYTLTVYLKQDTLSWARVRVTNLGTRSIYAYFDLANEAVGSDVGADNIAQSTGTARGGWVPCRIKFTSHASDTSGKVQIDLADDDGDAVVARDGTNSILLWVSQLEESDASSITYSARSADNLSYTGVPTPNETRIVVDGAPVDLIDWGGVVTQRGEIGSIAVYEPGKRP